MWQEDGNCLPMMKRVWRYCYRHYRICGVQVPDGDTMWIDNVHRIWCTTGITHWNGGGMWQEDGNCLPIMKPVWRYCYRYYRICDVQVPDGDIMWIDNVHRTWCTTGITHWNGGGMWQEDGICFPIMKPVWRYCYRHYCICGVQVPDRDMMYGGGCGYW